VSRDGVVPPAIARADGLAIVVMGVSASGKSTVAAGLAKALHLDWIDADDLHPEANVAKMASGRPLTDDDRWPWLDRVGEHLAGGAAGDGIVVACSALRRMYRDRLRRSAPRTLFVHLTGSAETLTARALARADHFMPASLLVSQFAVLEPLESDECGVELDVDAEVTAVVDAARRWVARRTPERDALASFLPWEDLGAY
jgi:carbohydrate kinase (thermoresistant glucokinase family)